MKLFESLENKKNKKSQYDYIVSFNTGVIAPCDSRRDIYPVYYYIVLCSNGFIYIIKSSLEKRRGADNNILTRRRITRSVKFSKNNFSVFVLPRYSSPRNDSAAARPTRFSENNASSRTVSAADLCVQMSRLIFSLGYTRHNNTRHVQTSRHQQRGEGGRAGRIMLYSRVPCRSIP